jgi:hypothetical protein
MFQKRKPPPPPYRHIKVTDIIDQPARVRRVTVECPLEYPGMTAPERRRMYEGLAMVAEAFRAADRRCEQTHGRKSNK